MIRQACKRWSASSSSSLFPNPCQPWMGIGSRSRCRGSSWRMAHVLATPTLPNWGRPTTGGAHNRMVVTKRVAWNGSWSFHRWFHASGCSPQNNNSGGYSLTALKSLRTASGAPVVECKKALQAAVEEQSAPPHDDENAYEQALIQTAMDWLRQHGAAKASSKVADRASTEGLVCFLSSSKDGTTTSNPSAVLVKVASETDFAGRSQRFVDLVETIAQAALTSSTTNDNNDTTSETKTVLSKEAIDQLSTPHGSTVQTQLEEAVLAIRENISVSTALQLHVPVSSSSSGTTTGAQWVGYVHNRVHPQSCAGTAAAAVLVQPSSSDAVLSRTELYEIGKKLAMHVVAARPQYLTVDQVPPAVLDKERDLLRQQVLQESNNNKPKPPDMVEKIVQGKLSKLFLAQVCLLEQGHYVEEKNPKIKTYLAERGVTLLQYESLFIS